MKQALKRLTALTLVLAMSVSLLCSTAWAAEENGAYDEKMVSEALTEAVEVAVEEVTEEAVEDIPETEQTETPAVEKDEAPAEGIVSEVVVEHIPTEEVETTTISTLSVEETLLYDDHVTLDTAFEGKYAGYTIQSISNQKVTSHQAAYDTGSGIREAKHAMDEAVLRQEDSTLVAVGIGTAEMTLSKGSERVVITVTVKPAPLTLLYLTGQSNMEGWCTKRVYYPEDSVLCPEGQVYSTYVPTSGESARIAGVSGYQYGLDVRNYVAEALVGTTNRRGTQLNYPINALTEKGNGKTGPDAAIAYEWNRLTGEKVWVINMSQDSTSTGKWTVGGELYERAVKTMSAVKETVETEVAVGHYTVSNRLMFWMQGEDRYDWEQTASNTPSVQRYVSNFNAMLDGFHGLLSKTGDVRNEGDIAIKELDISIQKSGIIPTRARLGNQQDEGELNMTYSRLAHYFMARSKAYPDIFVVTNEHEQWVSNAGVKSYFDKAYPDGKLTYPLRSSATLKSTPAAMEDVHYDIHFTQAGHNENGLTAARGMYEVIWGKNTPTAARFRNEEGNAVSNLTLKKGQGVTLTWESAPVTAAKKVTLDYDKTALTYDDQKGTLTAVKEGTFTVKAVTGGKTIAALTVTVPKPPVPKPAVPTLKSAVNTSAGIVFTWNKAANAAKYAVYRKVGSGSYAKIATTTATSYTDKSVTNGTVYTYTVRGVNGSQLSGYNAGKAAIRVTGVAISSVKNAKKQKMTVKWKKNAKATGYQVQYSVNSNFSGAATKTYKKPATVSATVTGIKKGKTYYVRVRAYKTASGVTSYSGWSGSKKVKISK